MAESKGEYTYDGDSRLALNMHTERKSVMARKIGRSRGGYPKAQNRKARSRKSMRNQKIISAMRGGK